MPLHWTIDPEDQLVTTVADGDVTRRDVEGLVEAVHSAGAHAYRKLFDGSRGDTAMSAEDLLALGVLMRSYHARVPAGPLAIVLPADKAEKIARVLGALAAADRPLRVFNGIAAARRWIAAQDKEKSDIA